MGTGGHASSGPLKDPNSGKSTRTGFTLKALPSEGRSGEAPPFPLPIIENAAEREAELWAEIWTTPQSCVWISETWRWNAIALYVRQLAICEREDAFASDKTLLLRMGDQIGMTTAGLQYNGWKVAANQLAEREKPAEKPVARPASARDRLKALDGGKTA